MPLRLADFDFLLPPELIAQHPSPTRDACRLLEVCADTLIDRQFAELALLLRPGDLLVVNDTRVIKARFFGAKASGGKVEVLVERIVDGRQALAQVRASKPPPPGTTITLEGVFSVRVAGRDGEFFCLSLPEDQPADFWSLCERYGHLPLPPYIAHGADAIDEERYQTVYARVPGAVAAPTAGLHFDDRVLARLRAAGIGCTQLTLHVGAGTFQPVRDDDLSKHRMHSERYEIPQAAVEAIMKTRADGGRVVAVGTTSLRALESATPEGATIPRAGDGETALFILPGYRFRCVDRLITNFHLPKSTLLMLVSAFAGTERIRAAYAHAIEQRYRFFSYGDAMFLERQCNAI